MHVESIDASLSIQDGGIDLESKTKLALVICSLFSGDERKNADPCSLLNYLPEDYRRPMSAYRVELPAQ